MKPGGLFSKLFMGEYFFTIALRKKRSLGIADGTPFCAETIVPASKDRWAADPILIDYGERTWLFYEAVESGKGKIEVAEVLDGCKLSKPTVVLEDECHYSYPFVFSSNGTWYMIPESSAASEVRLYQSKAFPYQWELQTVLLRMRAVDTTVFYHDGRYWLLTFLLTEGSEKVIPRAYTLTDWDMPNLTEIPWPDFDPLRVRGAGPLFELKGGKIRPAQISMDERYGDGLAFYRSEPGEKYEEKIEFEIGEKIIKTHGCFADGLHTYSSSNRFEAIDIRCREFDLFKIIKRIKH